MAQNKDKDNMDKEFQKFKEEREELCQAIGAQNETRQQLIRELELLNAQQDHRNEDIEVQVVSVLVNKL